MYQDFEAALCCMRAACMHRCMLYIYTAALQMMTFNVANTVLILFLCHLISAVRLIRAQVVTNLILATHTADPSTWL